MNIKNTTSDFTLLFAALILFSTTLFAATEMQMTVGAHHTQQVVLQVGLAPATGTVQLDGSNHAYITFGSPRTTLSITLTAPSGMQYVSGGAQSFLHPDPNTPNLAGMNYIFDLPVPEVGLWSFTINDSVVRVKATPVFIQMTSDSPIKATLLGGGEDYVVGKGATFSTVVVDGPVLHLNYTASATIHRQIDGVQVGILNFADDGGIGDALAGDGIATAQFTPTQPGEYSVRGVIQGSSASGALFERDATGSFNVVPAKANFTGVFTDRGVDVDLDGLLDQIGVSLETNVVDPGDYIVKALLTNTNGDQTYSSKIFTLVPGLQNLELLYSAKELKKFGFDGPYSIDRVILEFTSPTESFVLDELDTIGQTAAYATATFDREPIELTGVVSSTGIDTNANGLFEQLNVGVGLNVTTFGLYRWSGWIHDGRGNQITLTSGAGYLNAGTSVVTLVFPGTAIGNNGFDGPYQIRNFTIFGAGVSRVVNMVGETSMFAATQFEGYIPPPDMTAPVITIIGLNPASVEAGTIYIDSGATALDDMDGDISASITITNSVNTSVLGAYSVTYTVADAAGNVATATRQVTVSDTTAPLLTLPVDVYATAIGAQTSVAIGTASATDIFAVTITNNAPLTFGLGITPVIWTAVDANGNSSTGTQRVIVSDVLPPVIVVPVDVYATATGLQSAVVFGVATALDSVDGVVAVTSNAPVTFPVGITVVTWTAIDLSENIATAVQNVIVSVPNVVVMTPAQIAALTPAQIALLTPAQLALLTSVQAGSLTAMQLGGLTPAQLAGLTPAQIAVVVGLLTPAQIAVLTPAQLATLTPAQVAMHIASLTPAQIAVLTPVQLATLTPAQVAMHIASLTPAQIAVLTPAQLVGLNDERKHDKEDKKHSDDERKHDKEDKKHSDGERKHDKKDKKHSDDERKHDKKDKKHSDDESDVS